MSDDPKLSERYRELPREEPPRALDDAILAASRRAVEARPAPLVVPTGRRRWYFPVAAAAVIVLAVAVVAHVDREQPDSETLMSQAPAPQVQPPAAEEPKAQRRAEASRKAAKPASPTFTPDPSADVPATAAPAPEQAAPPVAQAEQRAREDAVGAASAGVGGMREEERPAPAPAPIAKPAPNPVDAGAARRERDASDRMMRAQRAPSSPGAASSMPTLARLAPSPEQWLQGIVDLRRQGRHEEADRELAEFRKRYPDYRLSDEMKAKVEKPQ